MVIKEMVVEGKSGLKSKPAALFIQKACSYKSSIWIEREERKANAKSMLGLLSLSIGMGSRISIIAEGEDEEAAVAELAEYINSL